MIEQVILEAAFNKKMNFLLKYILVLFLVSVSSFVEAQKLKSFKNVAWLEGRWESEGRKGNIYEEWKLINEQLMEGRSYKVFKNDTTFLENMKLEMEGIDFYYLSTVKDKNNGEPVRYKLTDGNSMHLAFKSSDLNNPTAKKYQWKQNNWYNIETTNVIKGKEKVQVSEFKKIK